MEHDHMLPENPPSYSQSHHSATSEFPSVPTTDFSAINNGRTLPPLPAVPAEPRYRPDPVAKAPFVWPSSNPLTAYYQPGPSQLSPKQRATPSTELPSTMDAEGPDSRGRRHGSVLSMDDPDVRLAAEALGDLRADFIQSPPRQHSSVPPNSAVGLQQGETQPEPLLSLLTTSHPLIGTAIGGSLSAYSASKNYSPRFKSSAEYVERQITPVVNTVGSVGRLTGVEGGVRWFLGGRTSSYNSSSDTESGSGVSHKRRKVDNTESNEVDSHDLFLAPLESQRRQRGESQSSTVDTLPAYDEHRSPSYEASQQTLVQTKSGNEDSTAAVSSSWQSRLVLSTSGLSVAMSEESLRSLKYCLGWLRWANEHIGKVILALKAVLEQYDQGSRSNTSGAIKSGEWAHDEKRNEPQGQLIVRSDAERWALDAKIAELKSDVLKTLKEVVDIVSKYAGGALPENARVLVRRHLTSLPQRFKMASSANGSNGHTGEGGDRDVADRANRVIVLAKEGCDMMAQVSGVLDGTIVSAEEWCERLGRKKQEEGEALMDMEKPRNDGAPASC